MRYLVRALTGGSLQIDANVDVEEVFVHGDVSIRGGPPDLTLASSSQMRLRPTQRNLQQVSDLQFNSEYLQSKRGVGFQLLSMYSAGRFSNLAVHASGHFRRSR